MQTYSRRTGIYLTNCLVISLFLPGLLPSAGAATLIFGASWALSDQVFYDINPTPNHGGGGGTPPIVTSALAEPAPDASGSETIFVSQFHPEWGTLDQVLIEVDASGFYTALLVGPAFDLGRFGAGAGYSANLDVSGPGFSGAGSDQTVLLEGSSDFLSILFGFDGPAGPGAFIGNGFLEYEINYEMFAILGYDENGDAFINEDDADLWEVSLTGGTIGTVVVTYIYTPAGSPTGGPPNGTGVCVSCGPLPGDVDLDGFVGIADMNSVLANWNLSVIGWNNGDLNGDGFVGVGDINIVLGNWNAGTPPNVQVATNIPEPIAVIILATGFVPVIVGRRTSGCD